MGGESQFPRRVFIEDARSGGYHQYLRVTWHPEGQQFVISHWREDVCEAATRVPVEAAPQLITLLANGLGQAAGEISKTPQGRAEPELSRPDRWLQQVRQWFDRLSA